MGASFHGCRVEARRKPWAPGGWVGAACIGLLLHENNPVVARKGPAVVPGGQIAMLIVQVHVHVKPECVEAFQEATLLNARSSISEPGVARFDVMQQADDPTRFVLIEAYRSPDAPSRHKETAHYAAWRDTVAPMMAESRTSVRFTNVFPEDAGW